MRPSLVPALGFHLRRLLLPVLALLSFCLSPLQLQAALKPSRAELEAYFNEADIRLISLSPSGEYLVVASRSPSGSFLQLYSTKAPFGDKYVPILVQGRLATLGFCRWCGDKRLVFSAKQGREEVFYAVDADGGAAFRLCSSEEFKAEFIYVSTYVEDPTLADRVVDPSATKLQDMGTTSSVELSRELRCLGPDPENPDCILMESSGRPAGVTFGPGGMRQSLEVEMHRINIQTGARKSLWKRVIQGAPVYDRQGKLRLISMGDLRNQEKWLELIDSSEQSAFERFGFGSERRFFLFKPTDFLRGRKLFVGFGETPGAVFFASNEEGDTFSLRLADLRSGRVETLSVSDDGRDLVLPDVPPLGNDVLVWDKNTGALTGLRLPMGKQRTKWFDTELAALQETIAGRLARPSARILDWDRKRRKILFYDETPDEPGRYFLYDRENDQLTQLARRNTAVSLDLLGRTKMESCVGRSGNTLSLLVTYPTRLQLNPPPVLVLMPDSPVDTLRYSYRSEVQVFSMLGFVVLQVGHRGMPGFGLSHLRGLSGAPDRLALEDVEDALTWLQGRFKTDKRRVVLFGQGFGAYLALRALERPKSGYRCALVVDPLTEIGGLARLHVDYQAGVGNPGFYPSYFATDAKAMTRAMYGPDSSLLPEDFLEAVRRASYGTPVEELNRISTMKDFSQVSTPVLLVTSREDLAWHGTADTRLWKFLMKGGEGAEQLKTRSPYPMLSPREKARLFAQVVGFLNDNLFNYDVQVGTPEVQR